MFFDSAEFTRRSQKGGKGTSIDRLAKPKLALRPFVEFTREELGALPVGAPMIYDVESYSNFFCVSFKCPDSGKVVYFERSPRSDFDGEFLRWMMFKFCTIGFYSLAYDEPMVFAAASGLDTRTLKSLSNALIDGARHSDLQKEYRFHIPFTVLNHVDLIEIAPLDAPLKLYAARLGADRLQDLPFEHTRELAEDEADVVKYYNINDDDLTILLYKELLPEIKLRETLGVEYNQDLRSRSDAQIAEAVIASELTKLTGKYPKRPGKTVTSVKYNAPSWIGFVSPHLRNIVDAIEAASFPLDGNGSPMWPEGLGTREKTKTGESWVIKTKIGTSSYKIGMGGLHSCEKNVSHFADEDTLLIDRDVASYYPRIILNERLFPAHLGEAFLSVFEKLVDKRLAAKAAGNKTIANALKITINGGFGKFGNQYSLLYSPKLLLQVTITGQLALLMLIEMLEHYGISVVSGNTDGVVIKCPKSKYNEVLEVVKMWEAVTGFETEETRYSSLHCRDVNNYYAFKDLTTESEKDRDARLKSRYLNDRQGVKIKGCYAEYGSALNSILSKNPEHIICSDAVIAAILNGTPVEETVRQCQDVKRFMCVKKVTGGAYGSGTYIGKVIRWYYSTDSKGTINRVASGAIVGKSSGAIPLMDMPPQIPPDLNFDWYIDTANKTLEDIGFKPKKQAVLFF